MAFADTLRKAGSRALGGGVPGAMAMVLQVLLLMWLRTAMNYQYKHGGTTSDAFVALYAAGGIARFYRGVSVALVSSPIARFGDTAANEGVKEFFSEGTSPMVVSFAGAIAAAVWRVLITPMTTIKTFLQVEGDLSLLWGKVARAGPLSLFDGALGAALSTAVGFYPWSVTFEFADRKLPAASTFRGKLVRRAVASVAASLVASVCSNGIFCVTIAVQTSTEQIGYMEAAQSIVAADGVQGLLFRGLGIKLISNAFQAMLFGVMWKTLMDVYERRSTSIAVDESPKANLKDQ